MALSRHDKQLWGPDSPFARELGQRIRLARQAEGLSQAALGTPLTRAYVSLIEAGHTLPSIPVLLHFAERLHVDPGWLLGSWPAGLPRYTSTHAIDPPRRPTAS